MGSLSGPVTSDLTVCFSSLLGLLSFIHFRASTEGQDESVDTRVCQQFRCSSLMGNTVARDDAHPLLATPDEEMLQAPFDCAEVISRQFDLPPFEEYVRSSFVPSP